MKERDSCPYLEQEWLKSSIKNLYGQELAVKAKFSSDIPAQVIELPPDTLTAPPESWEDAIEPVVVSEVATVGRPDLKMVTVTLFLYQCLLVDIYWLKMSNCHHFQILR